VTDYCTLNDVKQYLSTDKSTDDALLSDLITKASVSIDTYCQRTFAAHAETRTYDAVQDIHGRDLLVDDDLLSVTELTNGDGTVLSASDYVLLPANATPKYAVRLKASAAYFWAYDTDPEQAISVNGSWGYVNSTVAPADIRHAAARLSAWFYKQRDAPFEATGLPELGEVIIPSALPDDIKRALAPYVRTRVR